MIKIPTMVGCTQVLLDPWVALKVNFRVSLSLSLSSLICVRWVGVSLPVSVDGMV